MSQSVADLKKEVTDRWGALKMERSSWLSHYRDLSRYLLPRSGRWMARDQNRGDQRNSEILDNTGTRALKVLAAGLMSGASSPARPWFAYGLRDPQLSREKDVQVWLDEATRISLMVLSKSNCYTAFQQVYEEVACYGTAACIVLPDIENVLHFYPLTAGEYCIACNYKGVVDTLYREFEMTAGAMVEQFGFENVSIQVKQLWQQKAFDKTVTVIHAIDPRRDRNASMMDNRNMPFRSVYFELGGDPDKVLRESGFPHFPAVVPRWSLTSGDVYGHSPGMETLGDVKQLQHEQLRKAQAIDKMTDPALQVPASLKSRDVDTLPGGISFVDSSTAQAGIRPLYEVTLDLNHLREDLIDVRSRINESFFKDMFLMIANASDTTQRTASEINARFEEKMVMLGPVYSRLTTDLHEPIIDMVFSRMLEVGGFPPPPQSLAGKEVDVQFISVLAQAQRSIQTGAVDRFVGNLGAIAQMKPEVLDKLNEDEWADRYASDLGVPPQMIRSGEQVAELREARNAALAAKEQAAALEQQSKTANNLAASPMGTGSALDALTGYSDPSGGE